MNPRVPRVGSAATALGAVAVAALSLAPIHLEKGAELGRFKLGSTAIVLFGPDQVKWAEELVAGTPVQMGQGIALPKA